MNKLSEILGKFLKTQPKFKEHLTEHHILEAWPRAVGPKISDNCRPIKIFDKNVLLVGSESSSWLHQLHFLEPIVLEKLNAELKKNRNYNGPMVKRLQLRIIELARFQADL